jgi:hypothetical protein
LVKGTRTENQKTDLAFGQRSDVWGSGGSDAPAEKKIEDLASIGIGNEGAPCYICFSEPANSVVLDCGHGGICVGCAIDSMKKNNQCFLCRSTVYQIIEIDLEAEVEPGLYKVKNSFYVSKQDE